MQKTKLSFVAAILSLGAFSCLSNAAIVTYNFDNVTGASPPSVTSAPASSGSAANLTLGSLSGVGDTPTTQTGVFNNASSNNAGASGMNDYGLYVAPGATGPASTGYLEVTFTPDPGYKFQLSDLDFNERSTSTGSKNYSVRWSVDNFASDVYAAAIDNSGSSWKPYDSMFTAVTDPVSEPVTVRVYLYGGTGNTGSSANVRFDDVTFGVAAVVPEPMSLSLIALAALPLGAGRLRRA